MHKFPNNGTNPEEERSNMKMEGEKAIMRDQQEPRDTFRIAYLIHFLLGVGNLLPWNASITAVDYFGYLYPTRHVEKVFSVAYMTSSVLLLVLMIAWDGWSKKTSFRFRMNMGFSLFILSILVSPIMDWASSMTSSRWRPNEAYSVIVASVVACGLADGLVAGSLIGSAGRLPKQFMQAVFAGTASSGVLVSILRIITKASLSQSPKGLQKSAHLYFIVGASILFCCIVSCNLLCKLPVMQHYYRDLLDEPPCSKSKFWMVVGKIRWPASEAELSAIVMVVFLGIGLVGGSVLGWFWIL